MSVLSASVVFSQGQEGTDAPPPHGHSERRWETSPSGRCCSSGCPLTSTHTPILSLPPRTPVYHINEMREVVVDQDQGAVELSSAPGAQEPVIQSFQNDVAISRTPSEDQAFTEFQGNQQGRQIHRLDDLEGVPFQELIGCEISHFTQLILVWVSVCVAPPRVCLKCRESAAVCNQPKSLQSGQSQAGIRAIRSTRTVPYA